MEDGIEVLKKRMKTTEGSEGDEGGEAEATMEAETTEMALVSEEMESNTQRILEKIDRFTQQVSELLDSGKTLFQNLSNEFEEHLIAIHREQVEKWQEELKELRSLDASNEAARAMLHNAQLHILQTVRQGS